jgi:hypothetical protein
LGPTAAELAVNQPAVLRDAHAGGERRYPVFARGGLDHAERCGNWTSCAFESRPIEIALDAVKKIARLQIVARLHTADESRAARIPADAEVVIRQYDIGPGPPNIGADIKTRPVVSGRCRGFVDWCLDGQVGRRGSLRHAKAQNCGGQQTNGVSHFEIPPNNIKTLIAF